MSSPQEVLTSFLISLADKEVEIKRPIIEAGFPDIPLPAQLCLKLIDIIPELFPSLAEQVTERPPTKEAVPSLAVPMKRLR